MAHLLDPLVKGGGWERVAGKAERKGGRTKDEKGRPVINNRMICDYSVEWNAVSFSGYTAVSTASESLESVLVVVLVVKRRAIELWALSLLSKQLGMR